MVLIILREGAPRPAGNMALILRVATFIIIFLLGMGMILMIRRLQIPARVRKAEQLFNENDMLGANEIIRFILEKKKDYVPARYLRAQILIEQKQFLLAISELNAILQLPDVHQFVNEVDIHYKLADLYNQTQQWQKEVEEYKIILTFNPGDVKANYRVGHALYRQGKHQDVKQYLLVAYEGDPTLSDCLLPLGVSCYHLADYEGAENFLLKAVEFSPNQVEAHFYLGLIYKAKRDFEPAIQMFENARKDSRYFEKSLFHLGEIYFENSLFDKTVEILEQGVGRLKGDDDDSLAYRYLLAEGYEMLNKISEAVYHWEQIAKKNSNFRSVRTKLEDYTRILNNENIKMLFTQSMEELQPLMVEIISGLNYNIISKSTISRDEQYFKGFNIKRINEPPIIVYFNRTTREISEGQILEFQKLINKEKCKSGIYITTSKFSLKAKSAASSRLIELLDSAYLIKTVEKMRTKIQKK